MKINKEQLLRDPDIEPSSDVVAKALGEANNAYVKFGFLFGSTCSRSYLDVI
ncbi:MAG: hypothetical protein WCX60_07355 [Anaerovoracaceae bacterium]